MDVRCGNKNNQVSLCRGNGKGTICVAPAAVQSQLNNGAMLGSCSVIAARSQETLSEITGTLQVLVRPNPSVGRFGVFVQSENVVERIQLRILDLMGREMERMVVVPNTFFVIGERYGSGLYLLQVNQGQTQVVHKLVKME